MRGLHDVVNIRLGKSLYSPDDFWFLFAEVQEAAMQVGPPDALALEIERLAEVDNLSTYPPCTSSAVDKFERCVHDVKHRGENANPYAVCTASVGCHG